MNDVYIYGNIGGDIQAIKIKDEITDNVSIRVNSLGGDVFEGLAIHNLIKDKKNTTTIIDGLAASSGSIIALASKKVKMQKSAFIMIHNAWSVLVGDHNTVRDGADSMEKISDEIAKIYQQKTGKPLNEIKKMMDDETWFNSNEALSIGLIDEIIQEDEKVNYVAQCFEKQDFEKFNKTPKEIMAIFKPANQKPKKENKMELETNNTANLQANLEHKKIISQALDEDKKRRQSIRQTFNNANLKYDNAFAELMDACENDNHCSEVEAKSRLAEAILNYEPIKKHESLASALCQKDLSFEGKVQALLGRGGIEKIDQSNPFKNISLREMSGFSASGSHSSSDFPHIVKDVANKSMLKGWDEAETVYQQITSVGSSSDFKQISKVGMGSFDNLDEIKEGDEYKSGTFADRGESGKLATFGKLFSVSRQAIINDDLGVMTDAPRKMGQAAKRTIEQLVFNVFNNNPVMSDGTALFHANHKNTVSAGGISIDKMGASILAMKSQKDGKAILNITPKYLVVPAQLEANALTFNSAEFDPDTNTNKPNIYRNQFKVVSSANLTNASNWYLLADQNAFDTIEVVYLNGQQQPFLEKHTEFNNDGIIFKVRMDAGVIVLDSKTMVRIGS